MSVDTSDLRMGASNPEDQWTHGIDPVTAAHLADQILAEAARPEGIGPASPSAEPRDWSGLNRGLLNGGE